MTIYFNENKEAFAFEIENPLTSIDDEIWVKYANTDKWDIINGKFTDITDTDEYKNKVSNIEKEAKKMELLAQIDEIDKKRVRAIAEPQIKDQTTGQTWLEYYTLQVSNLRTEISSL